MAPHLHDHDHPHDHHHPHDHDHAHGHGHDHGHGHGHHHHHGEEDSYYIDQLCMVALSGAFGVICLTLYFWKTQMLQLMLNTQFHPFVLASGVALVALALVRAAALWGEAAASRLVPAHTHPHEHEHPPTHEHPEHGPCEHEHPHEHHEHTHAHLGHTHGHEDHDHGWAPWRYVVLLIPIMLFMLGLPNKPPKPREVNVALDPEDVKAEAENAAALWGHGASPLSLLAYLAYGTVEQGTGDAVPKTFKEIEQAMANPYIQQDWTERKLRIRVTGQYAPNKATDRVFGLVRFRMQCCAGDAVQFAIPVVSQEPINHIKAYEWVSVVGRIEFAQARDGSSVARIRVSGKQAVQPTAPDLNPWIR